MKKFILPFALCLITNFSSAQVVRDWYWPVMNFNKSTFYTPDKNSGVPTDLTRIVYYAKIGYYSKVKNIPIITDYEITDIKLLKTNPQQITKKSIYFLGNQVKIKPSLQNEAIQSQSRGNPAAETIFQLPAKGQKASWIYNGSKYTSSWTIILFSGQKEQAVKVIQEVPTLDGTITEYYVKHYGLVQTTITKNNSSIILDKFHERIFEEDLYTDDLSKNKKFNFSRSDDIFSMTSYEDTRSNFLIPENITNTIIAKKKIIDRNNQDNANSEILSNMRLLANNERPGNAAIKIQYDNKDYRSLVYSDALSNSRLYSREQLEKTGFKYVGINIDDSQHKSYRYINCQFSTVLEVIEWYDAKFVVTLQWYSDIVKNNSLLRLCNLK